MADVLTKIVLPIALLLVALWFAHQAGRDKAEIEATKREASVRDAAWAESMAAVEQALPAILEGYEEAMRDSIMESVRAEHEREMAEAQAAAIERGARFTFGEVMRARLQSGRRERVS